ncbi:hypothetical protein N752_14275 [Desulforamulus aquiferis]|nr:hypothetical protein N752_14275 [Desulforamulus aquiferis]
MNCGQMLLEVERVIRGRTEVYSCLQADGELIRPETILKKIREVY